MKGLERTTDVVNLNEHFGDVTVLPDFSCGVAMLDKYLSKGNLRRAIASENLSATGIVNASDELIGYMTMSFAMLDKARVQPHVTQQTNLPGLLPVAKILMIAVDQRHQGQGHGVTLILEGLVKAAHIHCTVPLKGIYLDAGPEKSGFYTNTFGFIALAESQPDNTTPMYLPMANLLAAISTAQ